jgi:hypothetical protein
MEVVVITYMADNVQSRKMYLHSHALVYERNIASILHCTTCIHCYVFTYGV